MILIDSSVKHIFIMHRVKSFKKKLFFLSFVKFTVMSWCIRIYSAVLFGLSKSSKITLFNDFILEITKAKVVYAIYPMIYSSRNYGKCNKTQKKVFFERFSLIHNEIMNLFKYINRMNISIGRPFGEKPTIKSCFWANIIISD